MFNRMTRKILFQRFFPKQFESRYCVSLVLVGLLGGSAQAAICYSDSFTYSNGALPGKGGWTGSATSTSITIDANRVKIIGNASTRDAIHTVSCGDPNGILWVRIKIQRGVGAATQLWNVWYDDTSNVNFAHWYGTGFTARGKIGTGADVTPLQNLTGAIDELAV